MTSFAEFGLGVEVFLDGECLHGVFDIVGGGDGKGLSSLLIVSSLTWVSRRSSSSG